MEFESDLRALRLLLTTLRPRIYWRFSGALLSGKLLFLAKRDILGRDYAHLAIMRESSPICDGFVAAPSNVQRGKIKNGAHRRRVQPDTGKTLSLP